MSEYAPDYWVVVEISDGNTTVLRVLASWVGGYTTGDSWKLSSTVDKVVKHEDFFEFTNSSGSTYFCRAEGYRLTTLAFSVYNGFCKDVALFKGTIRILEFDEVEKLNEELLR
jgi:hypothetical protein